MRTLTIEPMRVLTFNPIRNLLLSKMSHPTCACLNATLRGEIAIARAHRHVVDHLHVYPFKDALLTCQESHGQRVERLRALILAQGGAPAASSGLLGKCLSGLSQVTVRISESLAIRLLRVHEELLQWAYRNRAHHLNEEARRVLDSEVLPMQEATRATLRGLLGRL
ncbi:MAG: hypothetical protein H0W83_07200 [Planctomycetes bacterium]|nr:hypothetical protein [Planctomycetota bacterium]